MTTKSLLTVVIQGSWIRSVLLDTKPTPELQQDLEFYYRSILGLSDVSITYKCQEVPETFLLSLLGASSDPPRIFPSFDKEVASEEEKRKYLALIDRVADMERMRAECGVAGGEPASTSPTSSERTSEWEAPKRTPKYQTWVRDLLASLQSKEPTWTDTSTIPDDDTIAWIYTPVVGDVRETRGCRIITDPELGKYWSTRLGTELYPDVAICRRLSTILWRVNTRKSAELARIAIEWYVEAQVLETGISGLSPWIQRADEDLAAVLLPFQNLGPRQTFARAGRDRMEEEHKHPLTTILQGLEGTHVLSHLTNEYVYPLKEEQWTKYLRHVFRMYGIGSDVIDVYWSGVEDVIRLWIRGGQGVDVGGKALFEKWQPVWETLFCGRNVSNDVKFQQFLDTLDSHDAIAVLSMRHGQKMDIAKLWIEIFVAKELITDSKSNLNSSILYESIRSYSMRFLPEPFADPLLKPASIGPCLAILGYPVKRTKQGRLIPGLRYRNPSEYLPKTTQVVAETSILEVMQNEAKEDSFCIVTGKQEIMAVCGTKDTIHLGKF
jgi:hypothetical protein